MDQQILGLTGKIEGHDGEFAGIAQSGIKYDQATGAIYFLSPDGLTRIKILNATILKIIGRCLYITRNPGFIPFTKTGN